MRPTAPAFATRQNTAATSCGRTRGRRTFSRKARCAALSRPPGKFSSGSRAGSNARAADHAGPDKSSRRWATTPSNRKGQTWGHPP
jgi:hypothetical protein